MNMNFIINIVLLIIFLIYTVIEIKKSLKSFNEKVNTNKLLKYAFIGINDFNKISQKK